MELSYPVFHLPKGRPSYSDGIYFYYHQLEKEDEVKEVLRILDDVNEVGETLGKRRLRLYSKGIKLVKISKALFFLGDIIKTAVGGNNWFIDNKGNVFEYRKSSSARLVFRKIKKIIPIPTGGSILEVEGIPSRFKTLYKPLPEEKYAGILELSEFNYILYGLYDKKYDNTRRAV